MFLNLLKKVSELNNKLEDIVINSKLNKKNKKNKK